MDREIAIMLERSTLSGHATAPALFASNKSYVICRVFDGIDPNSNYGLAVYKTADNVVKCCSYFLNTRELPESAKEAEILEYFFDQIHVTHGWELLAWGRTVSVHSTLWGTTVAMVGDYPIAKFKGLENVSRVISELELLVDVDFKIQSIIQRSMDSTNYTNRLGIKVGQDDLFEIVRIKAPVAALRPGVYLTTDMGKEHAGQLVDCYLNDYQVLVIIFPNDTKILTSQYLDGLFGEAHLNCPSVSVFMQRFKIIGVNNAEARLLQWAKERNRWDSRK